MAGKCKDNLTKKRTREYVKSLGVKIDISHMSPDDLFYFALMSHGLQLPEAIFNDVATLAKDIYAQGWQDTKGRIHELVNGDIGLDDFNRGCELAHYLINGD